MTRWGKVSHQVRRAIAFHERFTIAQLTDSTGLTYEQVEQVVHRLVNRGDVRLLSAEELTEAEREVEKRVGRPRACYALVDDPPRRAEFLADLQAIAEAARLELGSTRRPDTPYYATALQAIEAMETGEKRVRFPYLKEIEEVLCYGREYEALVPEGLEVVQAHYDLALARLRILEDDFDAAVDLLNQVREVMLRAGLEAEADMTAKRQSAAGMTKLLNEVSKALHDGDDPLPLLKRLREVLFESPESPLRLPFRQALELLTELSQPSLSPQVLSWVSQQNAAAVERVRQTGELCFAAKSVSSSLVSFVENQLVGQYLDQDIETLLGVQRVD